MHIAEVAELVEPDPSRLSFKKHHACLFLACIAAVLALGIGLTIMCTRGNGAPIRESTGTNQPNNLSFSPSSQPSVASRSPQPSLSMRHEIEVNVLQRNATFDGNRGLALHSIMDTDDLQLQATDSNLYDTFLCFWHFSSTYLNGGFLDQVNVNFVE